MSQESTRIFEAICSFVKDLNDNFGKKYKPVALYNRLLEKTKDTDKISVSRHINAFNNFFEANRNYIKTKQIGMNTCITYSERVFLNIGVILSKTDKNTHKYIHKHLVTIYSLINIDNNDGKEALDTLKSDLHSPVTEELEKLNLPDTKEGNFIKESLGEMSQHFNNMDENANPMAMMGTMMQSGFFTKFMGDLQANFSSGEMNMENLMKTVTSVITETTQEGEQSDFIKNFVNQAGEQVSSMTGGQQNIPSELKDQLDLLTNSIGGKKENSTETEVNPTINNNVDDLPTLEEITK